MSLHRHGLRRRKALKKSIEHGKPPGGVGPGLGAMAYAVHVVQAAKRPKLARWFLTQPAKLASSIATLCMLCNKLLCCCAALARCPFARLLRSPGKTAKQSDQRRQSSLS